ncbi:MAG: YidC/Oxa1 family membrane protein insertase [Planctomycetota bacterium]|nr:MAG: YidC/Oxa1 family membrane protein insertase [Planctomycetota bacterium]
MRILQLVLVYGGLFLLFLLMLRACSPDKPPQGASGVAPLLDSFDPPAAPEERRFVLESDFLRLEWTDRGAGCTRVDLRRRPEFHNEHSAGVEGGEWMNLFTSVPAYPPLEGCESPRPEHHRRRDAVQLFDPEGLLGADLRALDWEVEGPLEGGDGARELRFHVDTPNGVRLSRSVRLRDGDLHVEIEDQAVALTGQLTGKDLALRIGTGGGILREPDSFYPNPYVTAPVLDHGEIDSMEVLNPGGSRPPVRAVAARWQGEVPFVVEGSKYYLNAIRPREGVFEGATAEVLFDATAYQDEVMRRVPPEQAERLQRVAQADAELFRAACRPASDEQLAQRLGMSVAEAATLRQQYYVRAAAAREDSWLRASVAGHFRLHLGQPGAAAAGRGFEWYLGPKDPKILRRAEYTPYKAVIRRVDYGQSLFYRIFFTRYVADAILAIVQGFQLLVRNWGVAIILMTILVRALLFPVNRRSQLKMAEYQAKVARLKPEMDAIKKKYAGNPQKQNEETFRLYREHKMSPPFGGCLPILLQFPVFIGLFAALRSSILLREEPFVLWMRDLSRPDALIAFGGPILDFWPLRSVTSLNVLPILMVVLWVLQQRAMPKPADPQQAQMQKMMMFMPIVFGLMLYNYAAGLSLYMITSSSLAIFETKVIRKHWPVPAPAAAPRRT